ncbi:DUF6193 family natural product biosynthesis protein [Streptomyces sp. CBMA156]|uniref:DUF6193 family natural product biosynthesis protein n=1 Tax=Streptomyces sp. CBMA156 TaxID=1930280 RepID=UPI00166203AC|nr:DUF6193 family natural product biosynthesis protein [Streptomyces sp. CBMA156]MBD0671238.1 hypothetical protein [Streptomyces sp. CBMA156]
MDPAFYPDVVAAGGLAAALERMSAELGLDIAVRPDDSGRTASIEARVPGREALDVYLEDDCRFIGVDGWSRGLAMIAGGTEDLGDIVRAGAAWGSGQRLPDMRELLPWLTCSELAEAADRGAAGAVDVAWRQLREWGEEKLPGFPEFGAAVEAAQVRPRLRQLLPFSSMWRLGFRPSVGHVLGPAVVIVPVRGSGTYRVQRALDCEGGGDLIAEVGSAAEAAALAEAHVPADLGPAVFEPDRP